MNILDTRDLQERLEELEEKKLDEGLDTQEQKELDELLNIQEEVPEFQYGESLIDEDDWIEYVQELLEDIGDIPKNMPWYIDIDWRKTSENIAQDYSLIDYKGTTYYYRNC